MRLAYLLRKPLEGTLRENVSRNGCGALNIDAGRIRQGSGQGRWPANVALSHKKECKPTGEWVEVPGYQINAFDSGMKPFGDGAGKEFTTTYVSGGKLEIWSCVAGCPVIGLDQGEAGRFSKCFHNFQEEL